MGKRTSRNGQDIWEQALSPTGVFAIFTAMNDDQQMHYVLKDHQGSLMGLADADGLLAESYSYDAFGRRRNADSWSYDNITTSTITDRGYTFHEHMDAFGLINMNGRVYDPLVGQMLSPDPFIQQPEYSQSYNRYGYVFNNPLRFTDPSGYFASGDTTGTQQGNAESIFIRKEREDQQKERLSYNTDESTDGPGVSQLQVEEKPEGRRNRPFVVTVTLASSSLAPGWNVAFGEPTFWGEVVMGVTTLAYGTYLYYNLPEGLSYDRPNNYIPRPLNGPNNKNYFPQGNGNDFIKWMIRIGGASVLGKKLYDGFNLHPNYMPADNTNFINPTPQPIQPFYTPIPNPNEP